MNKKGFTLAEVLITLGILGVVAAVTLPTMAADTKYKQLSVKLAKFASTTENAARAWVLANEPFKGSVLEYETYYDEDGNEKTRQNVMEFDPSIQDFIDSSYIFKTVYTKEKTISKDNNCAISKVEDISQQKLNYPYCVLNDGTSTNFSYVYSKFSKRYSEEKYGRYAFTITYSPEIKGLPKDGQTVFIFAVTELGYVIPNQYDKCLDTIQLNGWNVKKEFYTDSKGACNIKNLS